MARSEMRTVIEPATQRRATVRARPISTDPDRKAIAMTNDNAPAYGLWSLVVNNLRSSFIIFAFSFAKPQSGRDWRSFGAFSAFLVALFAEMYGYPLTIYLLSGWLGAKFPGVDFLSHDAGHLPPRCCSAGVPTRTFGPFHLLSAVFIGGGFWLLSSAWSVLYAAQRTGTLAGPAPTPASATRSTSPSCWSCSASCCSGRPC